MVGGVNSNYYAAFAFPDGTLQVLNFGSPISGILVSAAINDEGNGLITSASWENPYAAMVSSDGTISALGIGNDISKFKSCSINNNGEGLLGGGGGCR